MWFLIGFLALVVVEIALLIQLGGAIGLWLTLAWIIVTAGLGVILLKGVAMLGSATLGQKMEEFQDPRNPVAHRILVVLAGILLILPGPLTDTFGILLLFPPIRSVFIRLIAKRVRIMTQTSAHQVVVDGEWYDVSASKGIDQPDQRGPQP